MRAEKTGQRGVEAALVHGVDAPDAQSLVVPGSGIDLADKAVLEVTDALSIAQKQLPLLRQFHASLAAGEQFAARFVFQLGDAVGDGGLRHVHALRRAGEVFQL